MSQVLERSSMDSLSFELVTEILSHLQDECEQNSYMLDLRRVNKQFNEAIINVVFPQSDYKLLTDGHFPSCTIRKPIFETSCCQQAFDFHARGDWYNRTFLQGKVITLKTADPGQRRLFVNVRAAVEILKSVARVEESLLNSLIQLHQYDHQITTNPVFSDPYLDLVCSAALCSFPASCFLSNNPVRRLSEAKALTTEFWLMNTVFFLGDERLINYMLEPHSTCEFNCFHSKIQESLPRCLFTAILRCPESVARSFVLKYGNTRQLCSQGLCPLQAAFIKGDIELCKFSIKYHPSEELSRCCWEIICKQRWAIHFQTIDHFAIAQEQLLPNCDYPLDLSAWHNIFPKFYQHNASSTEEDVHRNFPEDNILALFDGSGACFGPYEILFYMTAKTGDVGYLRSILNSPVADVRLVQKATRFKQEAARIALLSNNLHFFLELHRTLHYYTNGRIVFVELAAAEGSIPHMKERLRLHPELLNAEVHEYYFEYDTTVGQCALRNAMERLRTANVEYLLGLGVRLNKDMPATIIWSRYRRQIPAFNATQDVLRAFNVPPMKIIL